MNIVKNYLAYLLAALAVGTFCGPASARASDQVTLFSSALGEERSLEISLPSRYDDSDERYPVIVVLDGEDHAGHMREAVNVRYQDGLPQAIVVGVVSLDRTRDFTFSASNEAPTGGGADTFLAFLGDELTPYLDQHYRTSGHVTLFGHSAGGLLGAYALVEVPELFDAIILSSPTVRWDSFSLLPRLDEALHARTTPVRIHLAYGNEDGDEGEGFRRLEAMLAAGYDNVDSQSLPDLQESHTTIPYLAAFRGLRTVFAPFQPEPTLLAGELAAVEAYYRGVGSEYGVDARPPQRILLERGWAQRDAGDLPNAATTFSRFAELYPGNPMPLVELGGTLELDGQLDAALATYQRSAEIMIWPPDLPDRIDALQRRLELDERPRD